MTDKMTTKYNYKPGSIIKLEEVNQSTPIATFV